MSAAEDLLSVSLFVRAHSTQAGDMHAQGIPVERGSFIELSLELDESSKDAARQKWQLNGANFSLFA